jgi:hypothetical protein
VSGLPANDVPSNSWKRSTRRLVVARVLLYSAEGPAQLEIPSARARASGFVSGFSLCLRFRYIHCLRGHGRSCLWRTPLVRFLNMRKRILNQGGRSEVQQNWLDLEQIAEIEFSSEDPEAPIEGAFSGAGWRASKPGAQTIRLLFDEPQQIRRIRLQFIETVRERTQEFVLRWSPDHGGTVREIVRQRWNFSPAGATREEEEYRVELSGVTLLELIINPDVSGAVAYASLVELRLAS